MALRHVKKSISRKNATKKTLKSVAKTLTVRPAASLVSSSRFRGISAVVINLTDRPERWARLQKNFAKHAPWLPLHRLDAVHGGKSPPLESDVVKRWSTKRLAQLFPWYRTKTITMSPGERGCCASHIKAWLIAAKLKRPLIVLEDDASALPNFGKTLAQALKEAPSGETHAIWLSSKDRSPEKTKRIGEVLVEPYYVWTTVGYVLWPAGARALLKLRPLDMPVDNMMAWHIKQGNIKAFSVKPACVRQAQTWNISSDVSHSDDAAQW